MSAIAIHRAWIRLYNSAEYAYGSAKSVIAMDVPTCSAVATGHLIITHYAALEREENGHS